jgi:hypothetical protein
MKKHRFATQLRAAQFLSIFTLLVICATLTGCGKSSLNKKAFDDSKGQLASFIKASEAKYVIRSGPHDVNESCKQQLLDLLAFISCFVIC